MLQTITSVRVHRVPACDPDHEAARVSVEGAEHGALVFDFVVRGTTIASIKAQGRAFDVVRAAERSVSNGRNLANALAASKAGWTRRPDHFHQIELGADDAG